MIRVMSNLKEERALRVLYPWNTRGQHEEEEEPDEDDGGRTRKEVMMVELEAIIHDIRGSRHADLSDLVEVGMGYEWSNTVGELRIDFPIAEARTFWIGQRVRVTIEPLPDSERQGG